MIEPLYTETEAARMIGVKPRSLRTEREQGRIGFKRVAGKVMYREAHIVAWQADGERKEVKACQGGGRGRGQGSFSSDQFGLSGGTRPVTPESVRLALETAQRLTSPSAGGSSTVASNDRRDRATHRK